MNANDYSKRDLILNNRGIVGHILKRYISVNDRNWDDCFAAGVLGLVEAASRYDFKQYSPEKFTNYAGYWIKKEIIDEMFGSNSRARGKIKTVPLTYDVESARYESCRRIERGRMWSALIHNILKQLDIDKTQLAAMLDVRKQAVTNWSNPNSVDCPASTTQKKIFKVIEDFYG